MTARGPLRRSLYTARAWRRIAIAQRRAALLRLERAALPALSALPTTADLVAVRPGATTRLAAIRRGLIEPEASLEGRPGRWVI